MSPRRPAADPPVAVALRRLVATHERRWVLAVSGGADSLFLLHQCAAEAARRGIRPLLVHVNHGLRGDDSDRDEAFVRSQARQLRLPLRVVCARPETPLGGNLHDMARRLRRTALEEAAGPTGLIFLGHHSGDQRESVLAALLKGKSPLACGGMAERQGRWIRPLLGLEGAWMRQRLARAGLSWREDSSNSRPWCERNHLRLELLAALEAGGEGRRLLDRMGALLRLLAFDSEISSGKLLDQLDLQPNPCGVSLERPRHLSYHEATLVEALRLLCRRLGLWSRDPSQRSLERVAHHWLNGRPGTRVPLGRAWLELGRTKAWLVLKECTPVRLRLEPGMQLGGSWGSCGWSEPPSQVDWLWWPSASLDAVILRRWEAGDRLARGRGRGPLLADLMGDLGFTPTEKALQVVLTNSVGEVLTSPGLVTPLDAGSRETERQLPIWMKSCPYPLTR